MKNSIVNAALVASTICLGGNLNAQELNIAEQKNTANATNTRKADDHAVLNGNWSISFDGAGNLHVFDKNNNAVRIVEGVGAAVGKSNGSVFNSPATYPVKLSVDQAGDLHIIDVSVYAAADKQQVTVLPHEHNGFSDPDETPAAERAMQQMVVVNTKHK